MTLIFLGIRIFFKILSVFLIVFAVLALWRDFPVISKLSLQEYFLSIGFLLILLGIIITLVNEILGSIITLIGFIAFFIIYYIMSAQFISGWLWLFAIIALIYLSINLIEKKFIHKLNNTLT
jgi:hypothetical protein